MKSRLSCHLAYTYARTECDIHEKLQHPNVLQMYHHEETQESYILYLEYADKHDYLAEKILDVRHQN